MNLDQSEKPAAGVVTDLRHVSMEQLQQLGVSQLAYIKPVTVDGEAAFVIHGADGSTLAMVGELELAVAAIRQNEMVPTLVH